MGYTVLPPGSVVKWAALPLDAPGGVSVSGVKKNAEDVELEARVRAHIRREMVERHLGVNEAARRLGVNGGTLSRILNEERGFGSGFILKVQRAFSLPAKLLLEEAPGPS